MGHFSSGEPQDVNEVKVLRKQECYVIVIFINAGVTVFLQCVFFSRFIFLQDFFLRDVFFLKGVFV